MTDDLRDIITPLAIGLGLFSIVLSLLIGAGLLNAALLACVFVWAFSALWIIADLWLKREDDEEEDHFAELDEIVRRNPTAFNEPPDWQD